MSHDAASQKFSMFTVEVLGPFACRLCAQVGLGFRASCHGGFFQLGSERKAALILYAASVWA